MEKKVWGKIMKQEEHKGRENHNGIKCKEQEHEKDADERGEREEEGGDVGAKKLGQKEAT